MTSHISVLALRKVELVVESVRSSVAGQQQPGVRSEHLQYSAAGGAAGLAAEPERGGAAEHAGHGAGAHRQGTIHFNNTNLKLLRFDHVEFSNGVMRGCTKRQRRPAFSAAKISF